MSLLSYILVFAGGGLGSVARFSISKLTPVFYTGKFPVATLVSNFLACLLVGILFWIFRDKITASENLRLLLVVGFCGGFSTFSAFGLETSKLFHDGLFLMATLNIFISLVLAVGVLFFLSR